MKKCFAVIIALSVFTTGCMHRSEDAKKQAEALRHIGEAYLAQGQYTQAIQKLKESENLMPDNHITHDDLGIAFKGRKEYSLSIEHFKKAVLVKSDYVPAINNLGTVYMESGQIDEAIKCFESISSNLLYATPHYPLANLGWAYYNKKMYEKSKSYYLKALEYSPDFMKAMRGLAMTYMALGQNEKALDLLLKAVIKSPRFAELHFELGEAYRATGNSEEASASYQKAVDLGKDRPVVEKAKQRLSGL